MKKHKRNIEQRAFNRGYTAGVTGKSKTLCPDPSHESHTHWMAGWRAGREDNWSGYTGVSGIHKIPNIST